MEEQLYEYPYRVVISESLRVLQREVTFAALKGYRPIGNVTITHEDGKTIFHQAIWSEQAMQAYAEKYVNPPGMSTVKAVEVPQPITA